MVIKTDRQRMPVTRNKIALKFDITMLNSLIGYLFKKSAQITRKSLTNMKRLFDIIDERIYDGNEQLAARLYFINKALEARLVKGFENESIIINHCRTDNNDRYIEEIIKNLDKYKEINYDEIKFINKAIQDRLKYSYILDYKDRIYSTIERLDAGDFTTYQEINDEMTEVFSKFLNQTRQVTVLDDTTTFTLEEGIFEDTVTDIVNTLKDPSRILKTGIQYLNQILAPGYASKRLYMYLGLPGGFKSGILLKTARDIKKYNKGIKTKKAGKRPCVLLLTMENSVEESVERLFNMTVDSSDIRNFTAKQVIEKLKKIGEMTLTDNEDIDIIIKYYPIRSIDTSDLYTIIDELSDDNKEVIALILDYVKRIKPAEFGRDEKEELKNVSNELKTLAIEKDIPVITAHQLNRAGTSSVDAAMQANKEDLARFVGRANVGSSWEIIENSDWVCIINVEKKKDNEQYYLTFKRVKIRYRDPNDLGYFNHPFAMDNRMQLIDDIYEQQPISEKSFATDFQGVDLNNKKGKRTATQRKVVTEETEDNGFNISNTLNTLK